MKTKIFFILSILLFMSSCEWRPTIDPNLCLPKGWQPAQQDKIKRYFPMQKEQKISYISDNGTEKELLCTSNEYYYKNTFCDNVPWNSKTPPHENIYVKIYFSNKEESLDYQISILNRYDISINSAYVIKDSPILLVGFYRRKAKSIIPCNPNTYAPKNSNEYLDFLADTIELKDRNQTNKTIAVLVAGKGLVWFLDDQGVKWTLKE